MAFEANALRDGLKPESVEFGAVGSLAGIMHSKGSSLAGEFAKSIVVQLGSIEQGLGRGGRGGRGI